MGAWGPGTLQNDRALDWLGDLPPEPEALAAAIDGELSAGVEDPEGAFESALAAAELVAALRGHPCPGIVELAPVLDARLRQVPNERVERAVEVTEKVAHCAGVLSLWPKEDQETWQHEVLELGTRLRRPVRALPPPLRWHVVGLESEGAARSEVERVDSPGEVGGEAPLWVRVLSALVLFGGVVTLSGVLGWFWLIRPEG